MLFLFIISLTVLAYPTSLEKNWSGADALINIKLNGGYFGLLQDESAQNKTYLVIISLRNRALSPCSCLQNALV